jgi:multiple sugar transport system substrate-binding protein
MPSSADRSTTFRVAIRAFGPFETAIAREWASFQEESGCPLRLEAVSVDHHALYEILFAQGGLKRGDWDAAFINTDWVAEAHERQTLLDLAPWIGSDPPDDFPDGWTPSLLRLQQFGPQIIGLPYHDGPECFIYRTDLLEDPARQQAYQERHGAALRVPETWDEFVQVARFLHRPAENLYGTVFAAFPDGHNTVYDICLQLWTRGGELFDAAGRMQLDTPQMIDALRFYRAIVNDGSVVHPRCREFDSVRSGQAFCRGEVAMMINWFGFASMCETLAESQVKGRVAVAPIPRGQGGSSASLNVYWMLSVAAGSPHARTAYRFLRHAMSRQCDRLRTLDGVIGCRRSTWADEEVNRTIPFYGQMESLHAYARELPRLVDWVEQSKVIDRMVLRAIDTQEPVETIVRDAQAQVGAA